ncbi:restriction endonuclease subunit S [Mesorhizobium sp. M0293]|uniref:restriction endonuclease subunit S n=1 Tax=Mesorhizobium sp. M0293 TaxID=2956930 RepID=UPI00333C46C3
MRVVALPFERVFEDTSSGNLKVQKGDYVSVGRHPIVDQGQEFVGGFTDDPAYLVKGKGPWIIFGDHTRALKFVDFPFCMGADGVKVLKPKPDVEADPRFLYHFLSANEIPSAGYSRHYKFLKRLEIPLPPLPEQRRIAAILDNADALRRKRKRAIELLDSLTQSIFLEMFGEEPKQLSRWGEPVPLSEVANIGSGITKGRKLNGSSTRRVPYLAVVNVQDRRLELSAVKFIEATNAEIARYRLELNDLLLTEGGDPDKLGRGTLWTGDLDEVIHQNHVFRVRIISNRILPLFLSWLVGSSYGKKYFLRVAKQTTGIASINKTQLSAFPTIIPPLQLQQEFAQAAERIAGEARRFALAVDQVDTLFSSLQHRAFSGQL